MLESFVQNYETAKQFVENGNARAGLVLLRQILSEPLPVDMDQLRARWWLGRAHYELDELAEAKEVLADLLTDAVNMLGAQHEFCQGTRRWLADTLHLLEEFELAQDFYEEVFVDYLRRYGIEHDYFLCLLHWTGKNLHALGRFEDAQILFEQAWPHFPQVYGANGPFALEHRSWWAANLGALGRLSEELEIEWEILHARIQRGDRGEALLWAFANLRDTLESIGDIEGLRQWEVMRVECGLPSGSFE